ncbi:alkaline phosphatase [Thalassomonas sp. M1454]|uniref:alkaline phosphatase n=1 Tax=Thalassomonas sp. M1454 TaxID=2594477 RepID=UPI00117D4F79|nr:alkaline phosphatase [Thalassomonas sp. M1454]TRX56936.1 alkaline phosphatase [Thalassomonas sp. M1454]
MKLSIKLSVLALSITPFLSACDGDGSSQSSTTTATPKNIIMVVADGMGPSYPAAFRNYNDDPKTPLIEQTIFDKTLVGSSSTYPASEFAVEKDEQGNVINVAEELSNSYVTDSAASATALATGIKTYNGAIGVDPQKQPLDTVLEWAKSLNKKTGIAVTSQIVHATPASYIAKNESRRNYDAIANDYFDLKINGQFKADVMLGGGTKFFIREDRNLKDEFVASGYQYIDSLTQLNTLEPGKPVLGLFAEVSMPVVLDSADKTHLASMTKAAVKQLENDNGFFLLVEASQVDWGGHSNDIAYSMGEMADLAATMNYLYQYVENNPDTLVVLTADHNTGGFSIGHNGIYNWQPEYLKHFKASPRTIAQQLASEKITIAEVSELLGFEISQDEIQQLVDVSQMTETNEKGNALTKGYYKAITGIIDNKTASGWTSSGHTGVDVPVYAFGQGYQEFSGFQDNTDIAKKLFKLMGK